MTRRITWKQWRCPLGGGDEFGPVEADPQVVKAPNDEEAEAVPVRAMMPTMGGMLPVRVYGHVEANFRFFVGHANFWLTKAEKRTLLATRGVETLDILSPYRFRVGVAHGFPPARILRAVEELLGCTRPLAGERNPQGIDLPHAVRRRLRREVARLREAGGHWTAYAVTSGAVDARTAADPDDYCHRLAVLTRAQQLAGGVIVQSHRRGG